MDTDALIKKLRREYVDDVDFGSLSEIEMEHGAKIYGWFLYGVKMRDTALVKCCLEIIRLYVGKEPQWRGFKDDGIYRAVRYSGFFDVLDALGEGKEVSHDDFSDPFNPFIMSLDDIERLFPPGKAAPYILEGAFSFVHGVTFCCMLDFIDPNTLILIDYLNDWIPLLVRWLGRHKEEIITFFYDEEYSSFEELCFFLGAIMYAPQMVKAFDSFFAFMKECVEEFSPQPFWESWLDYPLSVAITENNEHAFDVLMDEAEKSGEKIGLGGYPTESVHILNRIFSSGRLLPGTRDGREAFDFMIRYDNPVKEIIELSSYPDYYLSRGMTPLMKAVKNTSMSPEKYHLFVKRKNDVNARRKGFLPPLGYAVLNGKREAVLELLSLGADIYRTDRDGNNIIHYVAVEEKATLENILRAISGDEHLLIQKNKKGKTPLDYLNSGEDL